MQKVTMVEFRRDMDGYIRQVRQGKRFILTYRGKPVLRLEPLQQSNIGRSDPFYSLADLAGDEGMPLTNNEIDEIIYEQ